MRLVIIESPFAGDVERNIEYARCCVRDSLLRGEAPIASHLLYTQPGVLDDNIPEERQQGIDAGLAWRTVAQASVVYTDRGISRGMRYGINAALDAGIPVEFRSVDRQESKVTTLQRVLPTLINDMDAKHGLALRAALGYSIENPIETTSSLKERSNA